MVQSSEVLDLDTHIPSIRAHRGDHRSSTPSFRRLALRCALWLRSCLLYWIWWSDRHLLDAWRLLRCSHCGSCWWSELRCCARPETGFSFGSRPCIPLCHYHRLPARHDLHGNCSRLILGHHFPDPRNYEVG